MWTLSWTHAGSVKVSWACRIQDVQKLNIFTLGGAEFLSATAVLGSMEEGGNLLMIKLFVKQFFRKPPDHASRLGANNTLLPGSCPHSRSCSDRAGVRSPVQGLGPGGQYSPQLGLPDLCSANNCILASSVILHHDGGLV